LGKIFGIKKPGYKIAFVRSCLASARGRTAGFESNKCAERWKKVYGLKCFIGILMSDIDDFQIDMFPEWSNYTEKLNFRIQIIITVGIVLLIIGIMIGLYSYFIPEQIEPYGIYSIIIVFISTVIIITGFFGRTRTRVYQNKITKYFPLGKLRNDGKDHSDPMIILNYLRDTLEKSNIVYNIDFEISMGFLQKAIIKIVGKPYFIFYEPIYDQTSSVSVYAVLMSIGLNLNKNDPDVQNLIRLIEWSFNDELSPL
jgi:hypothetical protein